MTASPPNLTKEQIILPGSPGAPNVGIPAGPDTIITTEVDLRKEYVAAITDSWYGVIARALPAYIDDVTTDFGDDTYEAMMHDSQVAADVAVLKAGILEDGVALNAAIDDKDVPGFDMAQEMLAFCQGVLDNLETPIDDILWEMLDAIALGSRVAELIYTIVDGKYVLKAIKPKPRLSTSYIVDPFNNLLGLLARIPGQYNAVQVGTILDDLQKLPNFLGRDKFLHYAWRSQNGDPRGTSVLRPAYNPWYFKQRLWPEYLKYLTQFASPSVWGTVAPGAMPQMINGQKVTAEEIMLDNLLSFQNGTAVVFKDGAALHEIFSTGTGQSFLDAFKAFDHAITKAILNQTLATDEGAHMSRSASSTHQDVLDTLIRQAKKSVSRMVRSGILRPLVTINFPPVYWDLIPYVSFGSTVQQDLAPEITATAAAYTSGMIDASQLAGFDQRFGWPQRAIVDPVDAPEDASTKQDDPKVPATA